MITDKLGSYGAARKEILPGVPPGGRCLTARAPPAQGAEQPGGKLPPADPMTRTADEAVQVGPAGSTLPVHPRPDQQPFPPAPSPHDRNRRPSRADPRLPRRGTMSAASRKPHSPDLPYSPSSVSNSRLSPNNLTMPSLSRTRWIASVPCCSSLLTATNRRLGRCTASPIASASARSFFGRFT